MIFRRALIRLTLAYTAVQLLLFGLFGLGIYVYVTSVFDFDAAQRDGEASVALAEQGFVNLRLGLIVGYAILIVVLPVSSYLMARAGIEPIRRSYELQKRFVDAASHEFRTPLSVIQGELELALSRSRTVGQYKAAIVQSLMASERLIGLTNDLLLLTQASAPALEATFEPMSLGVLVEGALDDHPAQRSRVSVNQTAPVTVWGSPTLLTRAVSNVIDNAIKLTPEPGRISITLWSTGRLAHLRVSDDGVGMTPDELSHVFDQFWRAEEARTVPGFGLGLPLVRQICEAHRGKVSITSTVAVGTTVVLTLPESQP